MLDEGEVDSYFDLWRDIWCDNYLLPSKSQLSLTIHIDFQNYKNNTLSSGKINAIIHLNLPSDWNLYYCSLNIYY